MRRWLVLTAMTLLVAVPASGFAQTPSGDKMKDDKMKMEQGEKTKGQMKSDKAMKGDKTMKDTMSGDKMEKKDDKMEKMEKK
jgi:pentapeptide MXKDX repeat protein